MTLPFSRELFPGILDPDGRPWTWEKSAGRYQDAIVWLLKAAMLTQEQLLIPCGYIFDNPAFQRVLRDYTGNSQESKCFCALFAEFARVGFDGPPRTLNSANDWMDLLDQWISGTVSDRKVRAFPNLLQQTQNLDRLLGARTDTQYRDELLELNVSENGVDLRRIFARLAKMQLHTANPVAAFDFDARVRRAMTMRGDIALKKDTSEKLACILEAGHARGIRISRSLLQNPRLVLDLGVPRTLVISPREYRNRLALPMRHLHHLAFANAYRLGAICSETPQPNRDCVAGAMSQVTSGIAEADAAPWYKLSMEFSSVTFADVLTVRFKDEHRFHRGLERMRSALGGSDAAFLAAFCEHWRNVISAISWNFTKPKPPELEDLVGTVKDAISPGDGQIRSVAKGVKFLLTLGVPIIPKVRKEAQLRWFFRHVRSRSKEAKAGLLPNSDVAADVALSRCAPSGPRS